MLTQKSSPQVLIGLGLLGALTLSGCGNDTDAEQGSSEQADAATTEASQEIYAPSGRWVTMLDAIDADHIVVTPSQDNDPMLNQQFTVRALGMDVPDEGACGFDRAVAATRAYIKEDDGAILYYDVDPDDDPATSEVPMLTSGGMHQARVGRVGDRPGLATTLIEDGYAKPNNEVQTSYKLDELAKEAKAQGLGLYGQCPGF